jgi:hypothetical protein
VTGAVRADAKNQRNFGKGRDEVGRKTSSTGGQERLDQTRVILQERSFLLTGAF